MGNEINDSIEMYEKWEKVVIESSANVNVAVDRMNHTLEKSFGAIKDNISTACNTAKTAIEGLKTSMDQNLGKIDVSFSSSTSIALDKISISLDKLSTNLDRNIEKINNKMSSMSKEAVQSSKSFENSIDVMSIASDVGMRLIDEGISFSIEKLFENIVAAKSVFTGLGTTISSAMGIIATSIGVTVPVLTGVLVAVGAVALVIGILAFNANNAADGVNKLTKEQKALNTALDDSSAKLFNQETAITQMASETIPKLRDAYNSISQEMNELDLNLNIGSSEELESKFGTLAEIAKTSATDMMDARYTALYEGYLREDGVIDEHEKSMLDILLTSGNSKIEQIDNIQKQIASIFDVARSEGRALNEAEKEELRNHQQALNDITLSGQQTEIDNKLGLINLYMAKKGEMSAEEFERVKTMSEELKNMEIEQLESKNAQLMSAHLSSQEAYIQSRINAGVSEKEAQNEFNAETIRIREMHEQEIEGKMSEHLNRVTEAKTGHNAEEMAEYDKYYKEFSDILKYSRDEHGEIVNQEAYDKEVAIMKKMNAMGIEISKYQDFNAFIGKLPAEYRGIYQNIQKEFKVTPENAVVQEQKNEMSNKSEEVGRGAKVGVLRNIEDAWGSGRAIGEKIILGAQSSLEIASPSKAMIKLTKWVPVGAAKGIEDNLDVALDAAKTMGNGIVDTVEKTKFNEAISFDVFHDKEAVVPVYQRSNNGLGTIPYNSQLINQANLIKDLQEREQNITVDNVLKVHLDGEELVSRIDQVSQRKQFRTGRRY